MFEIRVYSDDDQAPDPDNALAAMRVVRKVPAIGEAITLVGKDGRSDPRRYRVVDVDHGYVAQHTTTSYTESTIAIYVIDADDPRRLGQ